MEAVTTEEVETITIERQSTQILCRIQMLLISIRGKDLIESKEKKIKELEKRVETKVARKPRKKKAEDSGKGGEEQAGEACGQQNGAPEATG